MPGPSGHISGPHSSPPAAGFPVRAASGRSSQPAPGYSMRAIRATSAAMATAPQTSDETNVVKLLSGTAVVKAALAEQRAAATLARRGLIAQIKTLERDHEKRRPQLEAALAAAIAAVKQAEVALLAAQKQAAAADGAKSTLSYQYSAQRDRLEQQLRQTAH